MKDARDFSPAVWMACLLFIAMSLVICTRGAHGSVEKEEAGREGAKRPRVMIELAAPPAARVYAGEAPGYGTGGEAHARVVALTQRHLRSVVQGQQELLSTLETLDPDVQILFRVQRVYNGIAVAVDESKLEQVRRLPNVVALHPLLPKRLNLASSVPSTGAPGLWSAAELNVRGDGVSIGVIDTGVDYLHKDFGGAGSGYEEIDPNVLEPDKGYPSTKVVGGYDFVGDRYDPDSMDPDVSTPHPDPNPMDCRGHGTHVAGIAAGMGVDADGETYTGPYEPTVDYSRFLVAPGMAPGAKVWALKVFGRGDQTYVLSQAIEWAVDPNGDGDFSDHLDIINMSLGADYGTAGDPDAVASDNAALAGVIVVASAGNSWNSHYVVGAPSSASRCISVASSVNSPQYSADGCPVGLEPSEAVDHQSFSYFSSRGPRCGDSILKPDITAPGEHIRSAAYRTGKDSILKSGTSMAAPHVAGGMALLRQIHPDWTVEDLKALVMNTASLTLSSKVDGQRFSYAPQRAGAGFLNLKGAALSSVTAFDARNPELVSLSFGAPQLTRDTVMKKLLRVRNRGSSPATFRISFEKTSGIPGVLFLFPDLVTVEADAFADAEVKLKADVSRMKHTHDPLLRIDYESRHWMSEAAGYLILKPVGGGLQTLRVPVYAAPRTASQMKAELPGTFPTENCTIGLRLMGQGVITGPHYPLDELSLVSGFELQGILPKSSGTVVMEDRAKAMIKAVGVSTDPGREPAASLISFGIGTYGPWSSPAEVQFKVFVDTDGDGTAERRITNTFSFQDNFQTEICSLPGGRYCIYKTLNGIAPGKMDTALFNSSVMVFKMSAADLGLKKGRMSFRYQVKSFDSMGLVGATPVYRYNAAKPGLIFGGNPVTPLTYADLRGASFPFLFKRNAFKANRSKGLLLLHHHNPKSGQVQIEGADQAD